MTPELRFMRLARRLGLPRDGFCYIYFADIVFCYINVVEFNSTTGEWKRPAALCLVNDRLHHPRRGECC